MKIKRLPRGIHEKLRITADDGSKLDHAELSPGEKERLRKIGFAGMADFLTKAEDKADDVLRAEGLPTEWPLPASSNFFGQRIPGHWIPDRLDRKALHRLPPNAEFAALLKHDVFWCRVLMAQAEFRRSNMAADTQVRECMYAGVIAGLAYWKLLSNLKFETAVSMGRRSSRAHKRAGTVSAAKHRKATPKAYTSAKLDGCRTLEQFSEHMTCSVRAVQKFEAKHPRIALKRRR